MDWINSDRDEHKQKVLLAMYLLTLHLCDFHERQFVDFPLLLQSGAIYYTDFRANHNETRITSLQN